MTSVHAAIGGWTLLKTFGIPVGCGYLFDKDNGLIGLGQFGDKNNSFVGTDPLQIFWTSDGGSNWTQAAAPPG